MDIQSLARNAKVIFLQWTMTMMFTKFPSTPVYGCTKLTLHEDGRIVDQRDYYDLWGDIFNGIPFFKGPYRRFMRREVRLGRDVTMKRELPEQLQFMANRRAVQKTTDASMRGRVCVVAGSTSGVGLAAVRRLARGGADIIMVCRNPGKAVPIRDELAGRHGVRVKS